MKLDSSNQENDFLTKATEGKYNIRLVHYLKYTG